MSKEYFLCVKRFEHSFYEVKEDKTPCDFYVSGLELEKGKEYYVLGFIFDDEYFYVDLFLTPHEAQRELFLLKQHHNSDSLSYIKIVVGDIVETYIVPSTYTIKPFIKRLTFQ